MDVCPAVDVKPDVIYTKMKVIPCVQLEFNPFTN